MSKLLLTGGTGFVGQGIIEDVLRNTDLEIVSLQRSKASAKIPRIEIVPFDILEPTPNIISERVMDSLNSAKYFIHSAAAVQALGSIKDPRPYFATNAIGTFNVLEIARRIRPELFVYISTAEVLGERDTGYSSEDDPLKPSNPYAASKGAGELLTYSYFKAYDLPAIVVRTMNIISDEQTDETKFIPMVKKALREGKPVTIHVRGEDPGVRQWIQRSSFVRQMMEILPRTIPGEVYHIIGQEKSNLQIAREVAKEMGVPLVCRFEEISNTHAWRYAISRSLNK